MNHLNEADLFPHFTNAEELRVDEQATIREAVGILESRIRKTDAFESAAQVKTFCQLKLADKRDEYFCCLFLDTRHHLIAFERLFRGTINSASVHPRVVVRRCLELNAGAVIFAHNHPSGITEPSQADIRLTQCLKSALEYVDVRVLDHIVTGGSESSSMAERGLI